MFSASAEELKSAFWSRQPRSRARSRVCGDRFESEALVTVLTVKPAAVCCSSESNITSLLCLSPATQTHTVTGGVVREGSRDRPDATAAFAAATISRWIVDQV